MFMGAEKVCDEASAPPELLEPPCCTGLGGVLERLRRASTSGAGVGAEVGDEAALGSPAPPEPLAPPELLEPPVASDNARAWRR